MKYQVLMNGGYLNSFRTYGDAVELRDRMQRNFPKARVDIIVIK